MPRPTEPKRVLEITVGEEDLKDAVALWLQRYHQIDIKAKSIEFDLHDGKLVGVKATKKPNKPIEAQPQPE